MTKRGIHVVEEEVVFMTDPDIEFVSLVKHAANQTPFKVLKFQKGGPGSGPREGDSRLLDTGLNIDDDPREAQARSILSAYISKNLTSSIENGVLISSGRVVMVQGSAGAIAVDPKILEETPYFIHNHPSSASFSGADMSALIDFPNIKKIEVLGHDGMLHTLVRGRDFASIYEDNLGSMVRGYWQKKFIEFHDDVKRKLDSGELAPNNRMDMLRKGVEAITRATAETFGLIYTKKTVGIAKASDEPDEIIVASDKEGLYVIDDTVFDDLFFEEDLVSEKGGPGSGPREGDPRLRLGNDIPVSRTLLSSVKRDDPQRLESIFKMSKTVDFFIGNNEKAISNKISSQEKLYTKLKDNQDFQNLVTNLNERLTDQYGVLYTDEIATKTAIRYLVDSWAATSGDTDAQALAIQMCAEQEFGLEGAYIPHRNDVDDASSSKQVLRKANDLLAEQKDGLSAFLRAQYENTQEFLMQQDIDELVLYRGVGKSGYKGLNDDQIERGINERIVSTMPLNSWSLNPEVASIFCNIHVNTGGAIFMSVVPKERIFSIPLSGVGCSGESEVVCIGGVEKTTAILFHPGHTSKVSLAFTQLWEKDLVKILREQKEAKTESTIIQIDADVEDADWTKSVWDLPDYGSKEFNEFLVFHGITLEEFKKLPVYKNIAQKEDTMSKQVDCEGKVVQAVLVPKSLPKHIIGHVLKEYLTDKVKEYDTYKSYSQVDFDAIEPDSIEVITIDKDNGIMGVVGSLKTADPIIPESMVNKSEKQTVDYATMDDLYTQMYAMSDIVSGALMQDTPDSKQRSVTILSAIDNFKTFASMVLDNLSTKALAPVNPKNFPDLAYPLIRNKNEKKEDESVDAKELDALKNDVVAAATAAVLETINKAPKKVVCPGCGMECDPAAAACPSCGMTMTEMKKSVSTLVKEAIAADSVVAGTQLDTKLEALKTSLIASITETSGKLEGRVTPLEEYVTGLKTSLKSHKSLRAEGAETTGKDAGVFGGLLFSRKSEEK